MKKVTKKTKASGKRKVSPKLKKLVIVESPSKASTIKKYLGSNYEVMASVGHVIDLPKSRMGVDLSTFEPDYIVMRDKFRVIKEIREASKYASEIILASDPDREGEAISWHIKNDFEKNVLPKIKDRKVPIKRVRFNEITEKEIKHEIENIHEIDEKLVNAQQGRRVIDRIFGYQLSPLLWKKVKSKLSAGRVQSIALRILCEREDQIERFIPLEYWDISVDYKKDKSALSADLVKIDGKKVEIADEKTAKKIETELKAGESVVGEIKEKSQNRNPSAPFITSTLQQTANNIYGYTSMKTMMIAQQLYEGVNLGKIQTGLITYMRTDSTRVSPVAMEQLREYIKNSIGNDYLPEKPNTYANKKSSQDAHEAIRPSEVSYHPDDIKQYLTDEQYKIYSLIWKRFVSSQMNPAEFLQKTIEIKNGNKILSATSSKMVFDGFLKVYDLAKAHKEKMLPASLKTGDKLELSKVHCEQKFTEPPPRYTDASLVKTMEEQSIGRPSTYAPTIYTLTKRYYVKKQGKSLVPTALGRAVNKLLVDNFPDLISTQFTSKMEEELDEIEEGNKAWKEVVNDFYGPFESVLSKAYDHIDSIKGSFDEKTDEVCDICGKSMVKKIGKFGIFLACSGWPDCKNTKPLPLGKCPSCEKGTVVQKKGQQKGRVFFGCSRYPECNFATYLKPEEENGNPVKCPKCASVLFEQREKGKIKQICLKEGCGYEKTKE